MPRSAVKSPEPLRFTSASVGAVMYTSMSYLLSVLRHLLFAIYKFSVVPSPFTMVRLMLAVSPLRAIVKVSPGV